MERRFDSVLSFSRDDPDAADQPTNINDREETCDTDDDDDAGFEFAFAPPLAAAEDAAALLAPADDLFAHGRILPAYPVFDRRHDDPVAAASHRTAPPSPDTYCAWAPRSAPGSPAREFPKSASTGEARRFWRLRDILGGGRSHSDGKEKFVFLQPGTPSSAAPASPFKSEMAEAKQQDKKKPSASAAAPLQKQKQGRKNRKAGGAVTEMDMATAHRLFYGKQQGALPGAGGDRKQHASYLPYRTGIVGFFTTAHALGRSHHPY